MRAVAPIPVGAIGGTDDRELHTLISGTFETHAVLVPRDVHAEDGPARRDCWAGGSWPFFVAEDCGHWVEAIRSRLCPAVAVELMVQMRRYSSISGAVRIDPANALPLPHGLAATNLGDDVDLGGRTTADAGVMVEDNPLTETRSRPLHHGGSCFGCVDGVTAGTSVTSEVGAVVECAVPWAEVTGDVEASVEWNHGHGCLLWTCKKTPRCGVENF